MKQVENKIFIKILEVKWPKDMRTYNVWWKFTRPFTNTISIEVLKSSKMQSQLKFLKSK